MTHIRSIGLARGTGGPLTTELSNAVGLALGSLGVATRWVDGPGDVDGVDAIVGIGYPSYYPSLRTASCDVPRFAWLGESLPPPDEPVLDRLVRPLRVGRVIDSAIMATSLGRRRPPPARLVGWRERAAFNRTQTHNLAAHREAARNGLGLVVTSMDRARTLARSRIRAPVIPFGYDDAFAGDPTDPATDRDIDLLVIGTTTTRVPTRRARITAATLAALPAGFRTLVVEDGVWGGERHALLRRARVVLNVHHAPGNFSGVRSVLAGAAGAVVVSEPIFAPNPFRPGTHYLEAAPDRLADEVSDILGDDARRLAVARAAQAFVVEELTMRRSVERLVGTMT